MNPQLAWYIARAGGLVAWWTASASVLWGLLLAGKLVKRRGAPAWLLDVHRFLGALAVIFTFVHIAGLVADNYVHFGWKDVLVPFASKWQPRAVAWGVVSLYLLLAIELTSLFMKRLPRKVWHAVHMGSFAVFAMGTVHAFTAGHDRSNPIVQWSALIIVSAFTFLALFRQVATHPKRVVITRRPAPAEQEGALT